MIMKKVITYVALTFLFIAILSCSSLLCCRAYCADTWSFAVIGDTRDNDPTTTGVSQYLPAIASAMANPSSVISGAITPSAAFVNGDLVNGDSAFYLDYSTQFANWKTAMAPLGSIPIYTVRGNHENEVTDLLPTSETLKTAYYNAFGPTVPQNGPNNGPNDDEVGFTWNLSSLDSHINQKYVRVIGVDQYFYYNSTAQGTSHYYQIDQAWLDQQLIHSPPTRYTFVMAHEPSYYLDSGGDNPEGDFYGTTNPDGSANPAGVAARGAFWNSLGSNGVKMYLCCHVHNLQVGYAYDSNGNKIYQNMAGNGGAPFASAGATDPNLTVAFQDFSDYGFALYTVTKDNITINYYLYNPTSLTWSISPYSITLAADPVNTWNTTSGNFSTGTNWDIGTAPGAGDTAVFNNGGSAPSSVTFADGSATTNNKLFVASGAVTFNLGNNSSYTATTSAAIDGSSDPTYQPSLEIKGTNGSSFNTPLLTMDGVSSFKVDPGASATCTTIDIQGGTATVGGGGGNITVTNLVVDGGTLDIQSFDQAANNVQMTGGAITGTTGILTSLSAFDMQAGTASAVLAGTHGLNKTTAGTVTLSGANTYSGLTTISSGALSIAGTNSLPGWNTNGSYSVANGATLAVGDGVSEANVGAIGTPLTILNTSNFAAGANIGLDTSAGNRNYASVIGNTSNGALGLTKIGTNTLTLSATNTYTGATTLTAGTLSAGATGNLGAAASNLVFNGGTLQITGTTLTNISGIGHTVITNPGETVGLDINNAANTFTFDQVLNQTTGGLTKLGAGTLVLNKANTYTGATTVSAGTLQAGVAAQAFGNNSVVTLNNTDGGGLNLNNFNNTIGPLNGVATSTVVLGSGTLMISVNADTDRSGNYVGVISGTGGLTVAGTYPGTQVLTGANLYSGVTTISGTSTLQIGNAGTTGTLGTGAVTNNAGLKYNRTDVVPAITNVISGTGTFEQAGTGTVTLRGNNTYTGATIVSAGTLQADNDTYFDSVKGVGYGAFGNLSAVTVAVGATLDGNGYYHNIGSLSGSGKVTESDPGFQSSFVVGWDNSSTTFSGIIEDGNGLIDLTKDGSGTFTLTGANTYTGATAINAGTVVAGNANALGNGSAVTVGAGGTLDVGTTNVTVNNTYTQNGTLKVTVASPSSSGKITSNANAFVAATSSVNVTVANSTFIPNNTTYTVVDSSGGNNVNVPGTITSSDSRLTFSGISSNGDLILTASRAANGFSSLGTNSNSSAVGAVLDNISAPSGDMLTVLNTLEGLSNSQTESALATLVPVVDSGVTNVSNTAINQFMGTSTDRLGGLFAQAHSEETGVSTGSKGSSGFEAWGRGFGEYAHQDPRGLSNGYHATIWGTAIGADIPIFNDKARIGADGGYASSGVNSKDNSGKTYIDSYQSTFYGGFTDPEKPYYINGAFSFAYNTYKGRRNIAVGTITRTANANYKGQQYSVLFDGGYIFKTKQVNITPIASIQYLRLNLHSYTETGADALDLSVKGQGYNLLESGLGAKFDRPFEVSYGTIAPEVHVRWFYDIITDKQSTTSTFAGGGGSFATNGFNPARNALNVGGKIALLTKGNWSFDANYDFEYKQDFTSHTGWADIAYKF